MIVVVASIFIDLIFDYNSERTALADELFKLIEENDIPIFQPDAFKIEIVGQLVRRLKKDEAAVLAEKIFGGMDFIETSDLFDTAFSIAFQTGSRAIDSFYIAVATLEAGLIVSNDKRQVESARKFGVDVCYLLDEFEEVREKLASR
jgi:hypothetical protein